MLTKKDNAFSMADLAVIKQLQFLLNGVGGPRLEPNPL